MISKKIVGFPINHVVTIYLLIMFRIEQSFSLAFHYSDSLIKIFIF